MVKAAGEISLNPLKHRCSCWVLVYDPIRLPVTTTLTVAVGIAKTRFNFERISISRMSSHKRNIENRMRPFRTLLST